MSATSTFNPNLPSQVVLYGSQSNSPEGDPSHTLVVMLNEQGNLCDFFYCGQLSGHLKK